MTFDEYQDLARRTQNQELTPEDRMLHALHGLAAEVGEIHSVFQKVYQGHTWDAEGVLDELGDLLWFAAELCDAMLVSMGTVADCNIRKLRKRYPGGFSEERSLNRE